MNPSKNRLRSRRLFWRIYLYGLGLVAGLGVATALVFLSLGGPPPWWNSSKRLTSVIATRIDTDGTDGSRITAMLEDVRAIIKTEVAVYDKDGTLISAAGNPPPPLDQSDLRDTGVVLRGLAIDRALPLTHGAAEGGQVVLRFQGRVERIIAVILVTLLFLMLAPVPFARAIASPLEQLSHTVRRVGAGELSARSRLNRRDEIGELGQAFDEMAARVEKMLLAEKELLLNVSHEIRTPLTRIRLALALCEEDGDVDDMRHRLTDIARDASELEELLNNVLLAARCEAAVGSGSSGMMLRPELLSVPDLLDESAVLFAELAPQHQLELQVDQDLPELLADRGLLRRLLKNLLENAAKYSDPGTPIEMAAHAHETGVAVLVSDRGIGVSTADLSRLFDPLFRTDRSRDRDTGGFGMGLAVSSRIAQIHGGTIDASRRPGGGLTVRLVLPQKPPNHVPTPPKG